jgi:hypothetical protein
MSALLPLADHGNVVSALPFVMPMLVIGIGLVVLVARDRLRQRASRDEDSRSSTA